VTDTPACSPVPSRHDLAGRDRLERVWAKNPTSTVFARLADAYLDEGRFDEASDICHRGLRYRPAYVAGHLVLGRSLLAAGREEAAREAFEKVLRLDRDHPAALKELAILANGRGDVDEAQSLVDQLTVVDPLNAGVAQNRPDPGPVSGEHERAQQADTRPKAVHSGENGTSEPKPFATLTLARLYADQGHHQEAFDLAMWLSESDPDAEGVRRLLADLGARSV